MTRRLMWGAVIVALLALVTGCGTGSTPAVGAGAVPEGDLGPQARDALVRWEAAVRAAGGARPFVPAGELSTQIGDLEEANGEYKGSLMDGKLVAAAPLTATAPATAEVRWADGTIATVQTIPAAEALRLIGPQGTARSCPECPTLTVTGARLSTMNVATSRGTATVPAWEFTLAGTRIRVVRAAVAPRSAVSVVPPSWDPYHRPGGLAIEQATVSADGRTLTASFTGSPATAAEQCGNDYTGKAVESEHAVVVIIHTHPYQGASGTEMMCPAIGAGRTATVPLDAPLGDRTVLEVVQGTPVPVTVAG